MGRKENVAIFEDTQRLSKSIPALRDAIKASTAHQKIIMEADRIEPVTPRFDMPAKIIVSRNRSFEAAGQHSGKKVCVLNFASATNPGGGVARGSTAQEECLCRCSTLYENLTASTVWKPFYEVHRQQNNPLYNDDAIYTPNVIVFKSDSCEPELLPEDQWQRVNVITCAAPNLRPGRDGCEWVRISNQALYQLHVKRMCRILDIAAVTENDIVILGAYGCGASKNPPDVVARAMKQAVNAYRHHFETIEFAVYCSPRDDRNFRVFQQVLSYL